MNRDVSAKRWRPALAAVSVLAIGGGALVLAAAAPPATTPSAAVSDLSPEQLAFARHPIGYFNDKCGNCHGNYGEFWGGGFAADKDDAGLREIVDEMCGGPAQAPLEGRALDSEIAYHRSLIDKRPFLTVFAGDDGTFRGEVTPGSTVTLVVDGKDVAANVDGHSWTSDAASASATRAEKDGKTTALDVPPDASAGVAFSHSAPLAPKPK